MTPTAEQSIAQRQVEGEQQYGELLAYVTGVGSRTASAYDVELRVFRSVLALGRTLLRLFFEHRAAERPAAPFGSDGTVLPSHDRRPVTYLSVFGKIVFERHAFTAPGQAMVCPLDAELSLPERCYSDLLREWSGFGSADGSYREGAAFLERILGWPLSVQALETTAREDAVDVAAFYERPVEVEAPAAEAATILVAQADGKGVTVIQPTPAEPLARRGKGAPPNRMREAVVTALYTIQPYRRTPEAVAAALLREPDRPEPGPRPRPIHKELRATLDGKAVALERLADRVQRRDGPQIVDRVALTDGAQALQAQMRAALPKHTLVLDIIHAVEYLWAAGNALLGERHPDRTAWVRGHLLALLQGQVDAVVTALAEDADAPDLTTAARKTLATTISYYQRNAPYMRYDQYLARGWPIGTGVVESACGHLVKDRMQQAGMRWTTDGAHAILDLRAIRLTDDWDPYWAFHRQRQHRRLYGPAATPSAPPEALALASAAAA
jgi:hypothetical protein